MQFKHTVQISKLVRVNTSVTLGTVYCATCPKRKLFTNCCILDLSKDLRQIALCQFKVTQLIKQTANEKLQRKIKHWLDSLSLMSETMDSLKRQLCGHIYACRQFKETCKPQTGFCKDLKKEIKVPERNIQNMRTLTKLLSKGMNENTIILHHQKNRG